MNTTSTPQICYLGIGVSDPPSWKRFATETLGLQVKSRAHDGGSCLQTRDHRQRLFVHPYGQDDLLYLGWEVSGPDALLTIRARLLGCRIKVIEGSAAQAAARGVRELIRLEDPGGLQHEVCYRDCDASASDSDRISGPQSIGHVMLAVRDLDASARFYERVLGLKIHALMDVELGRVGNRTMLLYRGDAPQHSIAIVEAPSPKRLLHFMLQAPSIEEMGARLCLAERQRVSITMSRGRDTGDPMASFFMKTPSGFDVAYGWTARTIDRAAWLRECYRPISTIDERRAPAIASIASGEERRRAAEAVA